MNRKICRIAFPSILTNLTVPLLALADTAMAGHLGSASAIGALAVGGLMFNMIYWLFGFLRMGTGGLTAQAYGAGNVVNQVAILGRSLLVALVLSLLLLLGAPLWSHLTLLMVDAEGAVKDGALTYYHILIGGAPAVLMQYGLTGWLLGRQRAQWVMLIAVAQNVVNIGISAWAAYGAGWGIAGLACGTLVAQWLGCLLLLATVWRTVRGVPLQWATLLERNALLRFFRVNRDIFLRTLCLILVTTAFTSFGASQGEEVLAANALLMQLFLLFSYVMDGFAMAGESLGGSYCGCSDAVQLVRLTKYLFAWGVGLAIVFTAVYAIGGTGFLSLLTNEERVVSTASHYLAFAVAIPLVSVSAFLFDGLFIGLTATRQMLWSMAIAASLFFLIVNGWSAGANNALWLAFLVYLGSRGWVQACFFQKELKRLRHATQ